MFKIISLTKLHLYKRPQLFSCSIVRFLKVLKMCRRFIRIHTKRLICISWKCTFCILLQLLKTCLCIRERM